MPEQKIFSSKKMWPISLCALVILIDQITKALVVNFIPLLGTSMDGVIQVCGKYLWFIHVRNKAVAFSMGSSLPDGVRAVLFAAIPLIIVALVFVIYFRNNEFSSLQRWAICGILGGGIGNLIDRFFRPAGVVDFISCYFWNIFGMERWPTFNIADTAVIICGSLFLIACFVSISANSKKGGAKND
ncbi:MAG: signal peptidase II [Treponema sp.]|nr:signal peptidase II [Treponema sp.]